MKTATVIFAATLIFGTSAVGQTYAGKWDASGGSTRTCPELNAHITVVRNAITINISGTYRYTLKGTVAADGSFQAEGTAGATSATGKFTGDTVELVLKAGCGPRSATGHRAS